MPASNLSPSLPYTAWSLLKLSDSSKCDVLCKSNFQQGTGSSALPGWRKQLFTCSSWGFSHVPAALACGDEGETGEGALLISSRSLEQLSAAPCVRASANYPALGSGVAAAKEPHAGGSLMAPGVPPENRPWSLPDT